MHSVNAFLHSVIHSTTFNGIILCFFVKPVEASKTNNSENVTQNV